MPKLNEARGKAGGCYINGYAYVVAGVGQTKYLNSIERLGLACITKASLQDKWELIQVPEQILSSHIYPADAPLNANEFVIMGGVMENYLSSVILFDTRSSKCHRVID